MPSPLVLVEVPCPTISAWRIIFESTFAPFRACFMYVVGLSTEYSLIQIEIGNWWNNILNIILTHFVVTMELCLYIITLSSLATHVLSLNERESIQGKIVIRDRVVFANFPSNNYIQRSNVWRTTQETVFVFLNMKLFSENQYATK